MDRELRRQRRMGMRGVPERLALAFAQGNIEMRAKPNGTAAGSNFEWNGYAAVYGVDFPMWDPYGEPYTEDVAPWAAKRSLSNPNLDVPFLIGHNDAGIPLARTKSGTMSLSEDTTGLHSHVPAMDGRREEVRALASAVERGDLDEMSLAFVCTRQQWDESFERRTVMELDLHRGDVCAVTHGANPATAGASMTASEQLSFRRPAAIGGPVLLERRMPTAPYTVHPGEDNACGQCGSMNDGDSWYCDQCGAKMPGEPGPSTVEGEDETQQCQSCLCMNATDAKYCDMCGRELAGVIAWRMPGGGYAGMDYAAGRQLERRAQLAAKAVNDLPDSDFAYIEPGGTKDASGKTVPRSKRHFPVHDAAHVRNALARIGQGAQFGDLALPKVKAAAKKLGVDVAESKAAGVPLERRASAEEDNDLAAGADFNAASASHAAPGLTCPQCATGNHGGAKYCNGCGTGFGTGASVTVDASTGIPGPEVQMGAAQKLEHMARELELEELASHKVACA